MSCQEVSNDGKGENKKKKFRDIEEMQRHAPNGPVTPGVSFGFDDYI